MLGDALIERYSRQILLPEVGGRGQERLGAAHVAVAGAGPAAAVAADLLRRAGVGTVDGALGAATDVVVDLRDEGAPLPPEGRPRVVVTLRGARGVVDTWPCDACATGGSVTGGPVTGGSVTGGSVTGVAAPHALAVPAALAVGALAAAETLVALLGLRATGRRQTIDLDAGILAGAPLAARPGCATCAGTT